jgi:hypothetical protein
MLNLPDIISRQAPVWCDRPALSIIINYNRAKQMHSLRQQPGIQISTAETPGADIISIFGKKISFAG